jgi:hypothetical protein
MFAFSYLTILLGWFSLLPFHPNSMVVSDEIAWKASRRLTWNDFKAPADNKDPLHALTATNIDMKAKCEDGELKVKVESVFSANESWSKNKKSDRLLFHEQLHFDITEIYARRLRKELKSLKNACDNSEMINKIADRVFEEWKRQEDLYDQETNHGIDQVKMKIWTEKIAAELKSLENFQEKD